MLHRGVEDSGYNGDIVNSFSLWVGIPTMLRDFVTELLKNNSYLQNFSRYKAVSKTTFKKYQIDSVIYVGTEIKYL